MRRAALAALLTLAALASPARAEEETPPEKRVFVEVDAGKPTFFVGEAIPLTLRVAYDASWFPRHTAPVSGTPLGLPVSVTLPPPTGVETVPIGRPPPQGLTLSLAVNDAVADARVAGPRDVGGRELLVLEVVRAVAAREPGTLRVAAPTLRFVHAERSEDTLVGAVPIDSKPVEVRGNAIEARVEPLPAAGRPPRFSGAVGRFRLEGSAAPDPVAVGEAFSWTVQVEGEGTVPASDEWIRSALDGFHVLGSSLTDAPGVRIHGLTLSATRADLDAIPAISLSYFEPGPNPGYREARSRPIPLRVTPRVLPDGVARAAERGRAAEVVDPPHPWRVALLVLAGAALAGAALFLSKVRSRRRTGIAVAPGGGLAPVEAFRRRVARGDGLFDAYAEALARIAGCSPAAIVGPDLAARLRAAGVAPGAADRAAAAMEALVGERYGGVPASLDPAAAEAILREATPAGGAPAAR